MKIELIKQISGNEAFFKYKPLEWCCKKMKDNPLTTLSSNNEYDYDCCYECNEEEWDKDCYNCDVVDSRYIPSMTLAYDVTRYDWEDEWVEEHNYAINYCPFCGEPIKISIVKEEDVSEILQNLEKEREEVYKKRNKTDSIKKRQELDEIGRSLDKKINWLYSLAEYEE